MADTKKETVGAYLMGVDHAQQRIADRTIPTLPDGFVVQSLEEVDAESNWTGSIRHVDTGETYHGSGGTAFEAIDAAASDVPHHQD
jgi:hypothetical protein